MSTAEIKKRYENIHSHMDEKGKRLWCGNEAVSLGRGGISIVVRATGMAFNTVREGTLEIKGIKLVPKDRIRREGGGRKQKITKDPGLKAKIEELVEASTRGDPESPLKWCSKSTRNITDELKKCGKEMSHTLVAKTLLSMDYSLQANRKTNEGGTHPDRDAQFNFINAKTKEFQGQNQPVISVDTKKKELIGNYKNAGREYHLKGKSTKVNVYDFLDEEKGKVSPYGIYDLAKNKGWVNVGISHDTAQFAVESIRLWWKEMGKKTYPKASELYINADGGGSNGSRNRLWKIELQKLATKLKLVIHVSHFPPGTSKWNKIEHRMFSFISKNWRGRPLIDRATVVSLIAKTTTKTGLTIRARLDENEYPKGLKISNHALAKIHLKKEPFHGEWNYQILP